MYTAPIFFLCDYIIKFNMYLSPLGSCNKISQTEYLIHEKNLFFTVWMLEVQDRGSSIISGS